MAKLKRVIPHVISFGSTNMTSGLQNNINIPKISKYVNSLPDAFTIGVSLYFKKTLNVNSVAKIPAPEKTPIIIFQCRWICSMGMATQPSKFLFGCWPWSHATHSLFNRYSSLAHASQNQQHVLYLNARFSFRAHSFWHVLEAKCSFKYSRILDLILMSPSFHRAITRRCLP